MISKPEQVLALLRQESRSWTTRQIADHFQWDIHYTSALVSQVAKKQSEHFQVKLEKIDNVKYIRVITGHTRPCNIKKLKRQFLYGGIRQTA